MSGKNGQKRTEREGERERTKKEGRPNVNCRRGKDRERTGERGKKIEADLREKIILPIPP